MRRLFVVTAGRSNDVASAVVGVLHPPRGQRPHEGLLSKVEDADITVALESLRRDGFHVFPHRLPEGQRDEIERFARTTPARYLTGETVGQYSEDRTVFDAEHPLSNRYQFDLEQVMSCEAVRALAFDPSLLAFAASYLGSAPILDLVVLWWSAPGSQGLQSAAAQLYHFDLDRLKFVKFFFYLTDVTPETGPHCYVKGSHRHLPRSVARDGRHSDANVLEAYGREAHEEICGPRGTILAVDTRGFHKGKPLSTGHRLLLQLEFTNSLFGAPYSTTPRETLPASYQELAKSQPRTYGIFKG